MNKHNHISLGTEDKPLIPNIELKHLYEKVKAGEPYEYILEKYSLESYQKHVLETLIAEQQNKKS